MNNCKLVERSSGRVLINLQIADGVNTMAKEEMVLALDQVLAQTEHGSLLTLPLRMAIL